MTIDELNALTTLTAADEVPVWDSEESGEPTKKITAQNMANSVKTLANLQGALTFDTTPTTGSTNPVTSGGVADAIQQSTANASLYITKHNVVISDGSSSSPSIINVDLSADIGDNSFWGADVYVNSGGTVYKLPYLHNSNGTYLMMQGYNGKTVVLKNTSSGWGTCTLYIVAYIAKV